MEHLESHHIKDKDRESIETEQAQEQYRAQYGSLLERHHQLDERLRKLEHSATARFQEKTKGLIDSLDQERHNVHLELIRLGGLVNKSESDITVDLLLLDESTLEYGLDAPIISEKSMPELYRDSHDVLQFEQFHRLPEVKKVCDLIKNISAYDQKTVIENLKEINILLKQGIAGCYGDDIFQKDPNLLRGREGGLVIQSLEIDYLLTHDIEMTAEEWKTMINFNLYLDIFKTLHGYYNALQNHHPLLQNEVALIYATQHYTGSGETENVMEESGRNFIFSSGFKEKVVALQNLLTDANVEVRPFASGSLDLHWHHRVYGVAIKRSDLLRIVDMIRNNQGKYWIESASGKKPESKTYSCLVNAPWEDYDGNKFKDALAIPEIQAIPNSLLSSADLELRIAPGIDSWEERDRLLYNYLEKYWDDILLKLSEHT